MPEEDLPKPFRKSAHVPTPQKEALPATGLGKPCDVTRHRTPGGTKRFAMLQIAPEIIRPSRGHGKPRFCHRSSGMYSSLCPVLQRTFHNHLTNTLHSPGSHKPHAANYRSLVICFARIPASRAKQTSRARGGTWRRVTQDHFSRDLNRAAGFSSTLASYCTTAVSAKQALPSWVPPHLEELNPAHSPPVASLQQGSPAGFLSTFTLFSPLRTPLPRTDAERERAGGGARWNAPSPVTHQFHFRDLRGHRFLSSHQHVGNTRRSGGEESGTAERRKGGRDPGSDEVTVNLLPPCWKGTCCAAAPAERGSQRRPPAPTPQHDFHQGATRRGSVPDAR